MVNFDHGEIFACPVEPDIIEISRAGVAGAGFDGQRTCVMCPPGRPAPLSERRMPAAAPSLVPVDDCVDWLTDQRQQLTKFRAVWPAFL